MRPAGADGEGEAVRLHHIAFPIYAPCQRKFTENSFNNRLKFTIWFDGMGLLVYHIFMCEYSFWGNKMARTFAILKNHEV